MPPKAKEIARRFFSKIEFKTCWIWKGAKDDKGYGILSSKHGGNPHKAHRISWRIFFGPIPRGMNVCHRCDVPACVRPEHLFLGTQKDNMQDASRKGRLNPKSLLNLQPGRKGYHGAAPKKEEKK